MPLALASAVSHYVFPPPPPRRTSSFFSWLLVAQNYYLLGKREEYIYCSTRLPLRTLWAAWVGRCISFIVQRARSGAELELTELT